MPVHRVAAIAAFSFCVFAFLSLPAKADDDLFSELKVGGMAHGQPTVLSGKHAENGMDVNSEILFTSPRFLSAIWAPRPHIGVEINTLGKTSYAYTGLSWTTNFVTAIFRSDDALFGELGLGGAIHDYSNHGSPGRDGLGTRLLFHEGGDLGYRISPANNISLFIDHVSNAGIGRTNPGLTNVGIRTGFNF